MNWRKQNGIGGNDIDEETTPLEAGLGFEAAMARVCDHGRFGQVAVELRHVLSDLSLGLGRRRAMQGFAHRTGVTAVGSFVAAILQADHLNPHFNEWCPWCPIMVDCPEPKRASEFAQSRIAELAPDGSDVSSLAAADIETYVADLEQFETARKCISRGSWGSARARSLIS